MKPTIKILETVKNDVLRLGFNLHPPFRASGAWLTHISKDYRTVRLKLPINRLTRNYFGTMCGGNIYSAIDGIYVVMISKNLGKDYIVWDKSASIRYRKPSKEPLYAEFEIDQLEIDDIKFNVAQDGKVDKLYTVELKNAAGMVCAEIVKTIHIKRKQALVSTA